MRSTTRLVTRKLAVGATVYRRTSTGAASTICSKLSSTISTRRPSSACEMRSSSAASPLSRMPRVNAIVGSSSRRFQHVLEADEVRSVREEALRRERDLDREAALADPAGADEADHAVVPAGELLPDLGDLALAPDRRGVRDGHACDEGCRSIRLGVSASSRDSSKRSARSVARSLATWFSSSSAVVKGR